MSVQSYKTETDCWNRLTTRNWLFLFGITRWLCNVLKLMGRPFKLEQYIATESLKKHWKPISQTSNNSVRFSSTFQTMQISQRQYRKIFTSKETFIGKSFNTGLFAIPLTPSRQQAMVWAALLSEFSEVSRSRKCQMYATNSPWNPEMLAGEGVLKRRVFKVEDVWESNIPSPQSLCPTRCSVVYWARVSLLADSETSWESLRWASIAKSKVNHNSII